MKRFLSYIRPEYVFVLIALFFQWRFNKITPPFQVPDEFNHFYKAYKISQGEFFPTKENDRVGGTIPWSIREFARPYFNVANNVKYITSEGNIKGSFDIKYSHNDSLFLDFPNTAIYSPVSYAPQALALYITQKFDTSVARMYYNGRYAIFLCWLVAMFFVIRMIPFGKWLVALFLLLPMNMYLVNSFSADTVTNILSFLLIAYVLKLSQQEQKISYLNIVLLMFLIVFLAFAKIVYVGLAVLLFIIPPKQFKHISLYFSGLALIFFSAYLVADYWSGVVLEYYTPYLSYNPNFRDAITLSNCANYHIQKQFIIDHRWYFTNLIYHSITDHPGTYLYTYIGAFGNMDLLLPKAVSDTAYIALGIVAVTEKNERVTSWLFKLVFVLAVFVSFAMLLYSQHLTWDCIGEGVVDLIQGRYLIPLMPLLFLLLSNTYFKYEWIAPPVMVLTALFLHRASCKIIYPRYFEESYYDKTEFYCDAEKINDKNEYITTNDSVFLEAGKFRTDSFAHSGKYSAYFDDWIQFNMTYRFKNLRLGDLVEISAWRRGPLGQIVISGQGHGKKCKDFFMNNDKVLYHDANGWGYMNSVFTMTEDCDSNDVSFFLWCPDSTKRIYFDDLKFSIKRYKGRYTDSLYIPK